MNVQAERIWSGKKYKGEKGYLIRQGKYELARTLILFFLAFGIFLLGYWSTGTNKNLMSVLAALGCLPASRSAVVTILYFRYRGCDRERAERLGAYSPPEGCLYLYDMIFTTYDKTYELDHLVICGKNVRVLSHGKELNNTDLVSHLTTSLKKDGLKDVSIKVFHEFAKYERGLQNQTGEAGSMAMTEAISSTLKSISL